MSTNNARMTSVFDYADHVIRLEVCLFNGREWLYLDDQLLEHKWNLLSCHSRYHFVLDGKPAEIKLAAKGFSGVLRGAYGIQLFVDGQLVDTDQFDYMAMLKQPGPERAAAANVVMDCWRFCVGADGRHVIDAVAQQLTH